MSAAVAFVLKGYPRLSETFIAQEIRALEQRGLEIAIYSLRHPTDPARHPVHGEIRAPVHYLPEYLFDEPLRVLRALWKLSGRWFFYRTLAAWLRDLARDPTASRIRRFGQGAVLASELPAGIGHLHAHFLHTPASVARYASMMSGRPWSCSAHAKDIWTTPDWEKRQKVDECRWLTVCTRTAAILLRGMTDDPAKVRMNYHGIDLKRFPPGGDSAGRAGDNSGGPVRILAVGRAVDKKGFDDLLRALATLPPEPHWCLTHVGDGELLSSLKALAAQLGVAANVEWLGALEQSSLLDQYRRADFLVLPSRVSADGDRDGLPNVLLEAQSQGLAVVSTPVGGIPELLNDEVNGLLVPARDPAALAAAIRRLMEDPLLRKRFGEEGRKRVRERFSLQSNIGPLAEQFGLAEAPASAAGLAAGAN